METRSTLTVGCVIYGIFAGGLPGNGPMVYSEDFADDLPSAMGIASIGRALAALSMGPLACKLLLIPFEQKLVHYSTRGN